MRTFTSIAVICVGLVAAYGFAADLQWNWRDQQALGRMDPSVGDTSRLTDAERAELISAIALRLQKPMSDAGYDSDVSAKSPPPRDSGSLSLALTAPSSSSPAPSPWKRDATRW